MTEAVTIANPDYVPPTYKVGDKVPVNGEEFEVVAVVDPDPVDDQNLGKDWTVWKFAPAGRKAHTNGRREDRRRYGYAPIDGTPIERVQHPRIRGCGHKFVVGHLPQHRNCKSCWFALFINDAALSEAIAKSIQDVGPKVTAYTLGEKTLTYFLKFVTIVAEMEKWKADHEPREPEPGGLQPDDGEQNSAAG